MKLRHYEANMSKLFKDLEAGIKEAIVHNQGKIDLRSIVIELPEPHNEIIFCSINNAVIELGSEVNRTGKDCL